MTSTPGTTPETSQRRIRVLPAGDDGATRTRTHVLDERAVVAFAAGIGDTRDEHFDLGRPGGILAHPAYPVCFEWPLLGDGGPGVSMDLETRRLGLHGEHRISYAVPLVPGMELTTVATLAAAVEKPTLSVLTYRLESFLPSGRPAVTTYYTCVYPGVTIDGQGPGPAAGPGLPLRPEDQGAGELRPHRDYGVTREGPTVYTECSTIWNPIHTDIRVARASGLPDIVVHGTETMARAITAVLDDQDLGRWTVGRLATRFTGMVVPGETVTVHRTDPRQDPAGYVIGFRSTRSDGATVLQGGVELVPRG